MEVNNLINKALNKVDFIKEVLFNKETLINKDNNKMLIIKCMKSL